eukprot:294007-Pelagomonas_calceolata.AAC.2
MAAKPSHVWEGSGNVHIMTALTFIVLLAACCQGCVLGVVCPRHELVRKLGIGMSTKLSMQS